MQGSTESATGRGEAARIGTGGERGRLLFFALLFAVFTCVFPYLGAINNPNENVRTYMTMALVEHHTFQIDAIEARHGWVNDMAEVPDKRGGAPHHFSVKGPATSFSGVPIYWALTKVAPHFGHPVPTAESSSAEKAFWLRTTTFVLRLFAVQLPCFCFLVWFERWLRKTSSDPVLRLSAVAAAGVGTNFLAYSLMFVSHATIALAAFGAFALCYNARLVRGDEERRVSTACLAGLLTGLAPLLEYQAFPFAVLVALYAINAFPRGRDIAAYAGGALVNAALLMLFQWRSFGSPFTPGHTMTENAFFREQHRTGYFGLALPEWSVFRDLSLSHSFGFFGLSPFMWLGLFALPLGLVVTFGGAKERQERRIATLVWLLAMLLLWLVISAANNWRGGWTVGPRFFGMAPPFFAFGAVCALETFAAASPLRRAIARGIAAGLALSSSVIIGIVGLHQNSVPEEIARPLVQFTLPLLKQGLVPYHVGDAFGWHSPALWYVASVCLIGAAALPAWLSLERGWRDRVIRLLAFALALTFGLLPAWSRPDLAKGEPSTEEAMAATKAVADEWEPARHRP